MSDQKVTKESEDCLLGRCAVCPGHVLIGGSPNLRLESPCRCICHEAMTQE